MLFYVLLYFPSYIRSKDDFQNIKGQEDEHACGQGGKKGNVRYICHPECAEKIHHQCAKKHSHDLHVNGRIFLYEPTADACQKEIADEVSAAGGGKAADACHIA